jgi:TolB-like protein/Flp pilus assembly protein TadD
VLPFQNMSADPENEYFSDGITEELLNTLAKVPGLHVAARTSSFAFKGKAVPIAEIAAALRVAHVVEGSVRKAGNRVRITVQLINAGDGYHLWSESYERDLGDIFALQREIAGAVGGVLEAGLTRGWDRALAPERSVVSEAYDHYLRGRFCLNRVTREDLERALEHFEDAIRLDPALAPAHSGVSKAYQMLADAYMPPLEAMPKAMAAAEGALELDPTLADAWVDLGIIHGAYERCWVESEAALDRALELNPNLPEAHIFRAWNLVALRSATAAVPPMERAFALDPLSAFASMMLGWGYVFSGRFDDAIRQWGITQELSPGMVYIDSQLGMALREKGEYEAALGAFEEVEPALGRPSTGRAVTLARMGRVEEAKRLAEELEQAWERAYFIPEFLADVFVALRDFDRAVFWLERGLAERSGGVQRLRVRDLAPLYDDPRYLDILKRAGLPKPPMPSPPAPLEPGREPRQPSAR